MKLREAIRFAKTNGGYVVFNTTGKPDLRWTEYSIQHYWKDDILFWVAGGTVGGEIPEPWEQYHRFGNQLDNEGFRVYKEWEGTDYVE